MDMVSKQNMMNMLEMMLKSFSSHGYGIKTKLDDGVNSFIYCFSSHGYGIKTKQI